MQDEEKPPAPPPVTPEMRAALALLGRRRQALMTPGERKEFARLGQAYAADAYRNRTRAERAAIARKGNLTRRMCPAWMRKKAAAMSECTKDSRETATQPTQDRPVSHPNAPEPPDLAALAAALDALDDDAITAMAAALAASGR